VGKEKYMRKVGKFMNFVAPPEAASMAGVTENAVRCWCEHYGLGVKVGGRWRINPDDLERFLKGEWDYADKVASR